MTQTNTKLLARIEILESKQAFQDDVIEQLNQEITIHQKQIAELKEQLELVTHRLKAMRGSNIASLEEETPPPHY